MDKFLCLYGVFFSAVTEGTVLLNLTSDFAKGAGQSLCGTLLSLLSYFAYRHS